MFFENEETVRGDKSSQTTVHHLCGGCWVIRGTHVAADHTLLSVFADLTERSGGYAAGFQTRLVEVGGDAKRQVRGTLRGERQRENRERTEREQTENRQRTDREQGEIALVDNERITESEPGTFLHITRRNKQQRGKQQRGKQKRGKRKRNKGMEASRRQSRQKAERIPL